jgi:hypothetical protein
VFFPFGSISVESLGIWIPIPTLGHGSGEGGGRMGAVGGSEPDRDILVAIDEGRANGVVEVGEE